MKLPGLAQRPFTVLYPNRTNNADGDVVEGTPTTIKGVGTTGSPNGRDQAIADRRGQVVNLILATQTPGIKVDAVIVFPVLGRFEVIDVDDSRPELRYRIKLRQVN